MWHSLCGAPVDLEYFGVEGNQLHAVLADLLQSPARRLDPDAPAVGIAHRHVPPHHVALARRGEGTGRQDRQPGGHRSPRLE